MCARLVVDHGQGYGEVRHAYAAALEHGGRLGCVARHVGRDHCLTDEGECVVECNTGLGRAARADVGRKSEGLGNVDVIRLDVLVNVADDELGQSLEGERNELFEAHHEQRRQNLVHGNDAVGILAASETTVVGQTERNLLGQAADDSVHALVCRGQLVAAEAFKQAVNKHECAEVRAHPAILPKALKAGDRSGCDHHCHGSEVLQPCAVVDHGVLNAAPLTPFCNAGLVVVTVSLAAYAVLGLPYGIKAFKLFINSCYYFIEHHYLPP